MRELFHHAYDVKLEGDKFIPRRFSEKSIEALGKIRQMFYGIACCPAGITLKFYTDADEIFFDYKYTILYTRAGGFDVYENGKMAKAIDLPMESCVGTFAYKKESEGETLIEIFFPSNGEIELWNLQLGNYRPAPSEEEKLVLYYGDSLTHSAYNTNASLSWVSRVARMTGTDYINRGVGSLFYDASYLDEEEGLEPAMVFVEFGGNDLVKHDKDNNVIFIDGEVQYCTLADIPMLEQNAREYLTKMKKMYPMAKISVLSRVRDMVPTTEERLDVERAFNKALERITAELELTLIDSGTIITPTEGYYVADNTHYTADGNAAFAEGIVQYVK